MSPMYDLNGNYSMFIIYRRAGIVSKQAALPIVGAEGVYQLYGLEGGEEVYLKTFEDFNEFLDKDLPVIVKPGVKFRTPTHVDFSGAHTGVFSTDKGAVVSIVTGLNRDESLALANRILRLLSGERETKTLDGTVHQLLIGNNK